MPRVSPSPEVWVQLAAKLYEWTYVRSRKGVPMAHKQGNGHWASFCWFGRGQYFKVFVDGEAIGCTKGNEGLGELVYEAERRIA